MKTKKMVYLSLMVAYSLALYLLETYIPNPLIALFPGAKLGLSNIITLLCLITIGFKNTFVILNIRILLSSIFAGPLSYLVFSILGGYLSLFAMYFAFKYIKLSKISISVLGAIFHNIGQLLAASLIIESFSIFSYLPFMLVTSIITGIFIGIVCKFTYPKLKHQINPL